jgi:cold shock CspA family protein
MEKQRMTGRIKFYDSAKGWGFVSFKDDDGRSKDAFFGKNDLKTPFSAGPDVKVSFFLTQGPKGPRALQVTILREELERIRNNVS